MPLPTPPVRVSLGLLGKGSVAVAYTSAALISCGLPKGSELPTPWWPEGTGVMALESGALWGSGGLWGAEGSARPCMEPRVDGGPELMDRTEGADASGGGHCRMELLREVLMCRGACWDGVGPPPELLGLVLIMVPPLLLLPLLLI